ADLSVHETGAATIAPQALIILLIVIGLPVAWLVAEFSERRSLRIALGAAALATATLAAYQTAGLLSRLNYNAWYGTASKELVETTIEQVEDGNIDRVLGILRRLDLDYQPTYENRAHYNELVTEAVVQMAGDDDLQGTKW